MSGQPRIGTLSNELPLFRFAGPKESLEQEETEVFSPFPLFPYVHKLSAS
jgi:hypothetical protein